MDKWPAGVIINSQVNKLVRGFIFILVYLYKKLKPLISPSLNIDQSLFNGNRNSLRPTYGIKFLQDIVDMKVNRTPAYAEDH